MSPPFLLTTFFPFFFTTYLLSLLFSFIRLFFLFFAHFVAVRPISEFAYYFRRTHGPRFAFPVSRTHAV